MYTHTVMTTYQGSFVQAIKFKLSNCENVAMKHLQENALYYSQAIWANLDETE